MVLGSFGDSFLFGSDLSDAKTPYYVKFFRPSQKTYPALLAKSLGLNYYCTALPAQGNKVIADDIIRAVNYHGNNMFYVVNWTYIDRFEFIGNARIETVAWARHKTPAVGWQSTLPNLNDPKSKFFYKHFYTDIDAKLSNLICIKAALDCLRENNCKFIMTYMDHLLFDRKYNSTVSIEYLQDKTKPHCHTYNGKNFLDWSRANGFAESNHCHPLEDAHRAAAEHWISVVNNLIYE